MPFACPLYLGLTNGPLMLVCRAVSSHRLVPGDVVVVLRGKATCDLVLLQGNCLVEESILSGEVLCSVLVPHIRLVCLHHTWTSHAQHCLCKRRRLLLFLLPLCGVVVCALAAEPDLPCCWFLQQHLSIGILQLKPCLEQHVRSACMHWR